MSISPSLTRIFVAAAAACSLLVAAAPAQAAVVGSFDPSFGGSIGNLGFRGTFKLDVSSGCYANGPGYEYTGYGYGYGGFSGCEITVDSMVIDFYDTQNPGQTLQSMDLVTSDYVSAIDYVYGAYFDLQTDQLVAFDSNDSGEFPVSVMDANVNYTGNMDLYFVSGHEEDGPTSSGAFAVNCNSVIEGSCNRDTGTNSNPASVTITTIPEPGTIPLAVLGVVALVAVRRRAGNKPSLGRCRAH